MAGRPDAPNLIGDSLDESVIRQLERRAQRLTQAGVRAGTDIRYLGNKNCWVRLTSFVAVQPSGLNDIRSGIDKEFPVEGGTYLAQQWALRGEQRDGNNLKYGVNNVTGAYGSGGIKEIGYRPMPGIQSVSIESQPPLGAINSAVIKIKAMNLNQLSMLDILYFRLGFSMLLEWGHSVFVDNDGRLINGATPIDAFKDNITKEQIMQQLAAKRKKYSHNYEGMLGLVTNYEWSQNPDGSYDCTLRLSGIGSIIESLKINTQDATPRTALLPFTNGAGPIPNPPTTVLPGGVPGFTRTGITGPTTPSSVDSNQIALAVDSSITAFTSRLQSAWSADALEPTFFPNLFANGLDLLNNPTQAFRYGYNTKYMSLPDNANIPPTIPVADLLNLQLFTKVEVIEVDGTEKPSSAARYIPLATLLAYLNNSCLLYDKSNQEKKPAIYIDFNQNSNFCLRIPQQFSVDPGVCLVDVSCTDSDYAELFSIRGINISKITSPSSPVNGNLQKKILAASGIPYVDTTNAFRGKFMNILVNMDCIKATLDENTDANKNIYLSQFLSALMQKIQVALGNINNFKIGYDETANTVIIYDAQLVDMDKRDRPIPSLPVFGLTSTVREYSLKTEASAKLGSMLAITARAGARNNGTNTDNSAFTVLNKSLEDRLFVGVSTNPKTDETLPAPPTGSLEGIESLGNTFNQQIGKLYQITSERTSYDTAAVSSIQQFYIASMLLLKGAKVGESEKIDSVTATGILPLALNITMDGIGGIPLYQAFTVPVNRLPAQYVSKGTPRVGFTVAGLTHTIENNQWTTAIRGLMINIPNSRRVYTPSYQSPTQTRVSEQDRLPIIPGGNRVCVSTKPLADQSTATPAKYVDKIVKTRAGVKLNNVEGKSQKYIYIEYLAEIENNTEIFRGLSKGLKCLMTAQAIHEGFYPGARAYTYKNPGNIGNTDSGANKNLSPLTKGILAQATYIREAADPGRKKGHHAYIQYSQPNYYSPELKECVPGFSFNYTGTLGQYLRIYSTAARLSNRYLSEIMGFFKYNGLTVNADTKLADIIKMM